MKLWSFSIYIAAIAAIALPQQSGTDDAPSVSRAQDGEDSFDTLNTIPPSSSRFHRRATNPATDEQWATAVRKGGLLITQMEATDAEAGQMYDPPQNSAQSKFESFPQDLKKWGYDVAPYDEYTDFTTSLPIKAVLAGLDVDISINDPDGISLNTAFMWEHEHPVTVGGIEYRPTHASFITVFNPVEGVIIAWDKRGPAYMGAQQNPPVTVLPGLKSWSDIAFLQWAALAGKDVKRIRYIISSPVENNPSQALIARALLDAGKELELYPGTSFSTDSEAGKAIMAAPNAVGVAYFLSQHKRQLGLKKVSQIQVFADGGRAPIPRPPSLLFHIVDVK